ncbi:hypothetical protein P691DRAFT_587049 [Macrolepiota fuliginosa MF-IS2]|uniref:Uncharacterized protein n=1 Tax=Macrolepiota fuliginosa MF-IS2 TaxID=1400762 RepID=A0A9P6BX22_9AGAR|nr:hypothetical protein P691DRAFT_587049 [Macrolepiota fuliginosa MF-IS2]
MLIFVIGLSDEATTRLFIYRSRDTFRAKTFTFLGVGRTKCYAGETTVVFGTFPHTPLGLNFETPIYKSLPYFHFVHNFIYRYTETGSHAALPCLFSL